VREGIRWDAQPAVNVCGTSGTPANKVSFKQKTFSLTLQMHHGAKVLPGFNIIDIVFIIAALLERFLIREL
jgi:hypothetical protein